MGKRDPPQTWFVCRYCSQWNSIPRECLNDASSADSDRRWFVCRYCSQWNSIPRECLNDASSADSDRSSDSDSGDSGQEEEEQQPPVYVQCTTPACGKMCPQWSCWCNTCQSMYCSRDCGEIHPCALGDEQTCRLCRFCCPRCFRYVCEEHVVEDKRLHAYRCCTRCSEH